MSESIAAEEFVYFANEFEAYWLNPDTFRRGGSYIERARDETNEEWDARELAFHAGTVEEMTG